ncbi:MAG: hypothetical protein A2X82_19755 [Geobacteraceae bacterium GWC2_55_20]|nr:MAG: hypothetical protein A2X82_19755 [Geobacteraceae bacterium GWC2_55_20]OGU19256.1 MAG: hypothetical protein A2X85_04060 [Geobacteraceae bacterium GWF2_54_21]HCE66112.1 hypothetical protein [Geobacter sp.]
MARTAEETATILSELFNENFEQDYSEPFRITWPQLRFLSGVPRLSDNYLKDINTELSKSSGDILIPLNNFLLVTRERDLEHFRLVPDRLLEQHLPDDTENTEIDDDDFE